MLPERRSSVAISPGVGRESRRPFPLATHRAENTTSRAPTRWLSLLVGAILIMVIPLALFGSACASEMTPAASPVGATYWLVLFMAVVFPVVMTVLALMLVLLWRSTVRLDAEVKRTQAEVAELRAKAAEAHALERVDDRLRTDIAAVSGHLDELGARVGGVEATMEEVLREVQDVARKLGERPA